MNEKLRKISSALFGAPRLNKGLRILITVNSVMIFILGIFAPFYAVFIQKIGGSIIFAGISWGLFSIVTGILTIFFSNWGFKTDEPELMVALGYFIRGIVFLSYAFMTNISQLIFTQILWGIGAAIGTPAFDVAYSEHIDHQASSILQWGEYEGISSMTTGVAAIAGGFLIQGLGYQFTFIVMAIAAISLGSYLWLLPRKTI